MGEPSLGTPASERSLIDRLDSWKEIASYLKRDVTTVQRWEKREGMPVHRHLHDKIGSVYASRAELDAWMAGRILRTEQETGKHALPSESAEEQLPPTRSTFRQGWKFALLLATVGMLAFGAGLWVRRTDYLWRNPIANAKFQIVTDFDGTEQAAAVSRDGHFVAFLSDRDKQIDVWVSVTGFGRQVQSALKLLF
jgi:hypothetical protein